MTSGLTGTCSPPHDKCMSDKLYEKVMERALKLLSFKPRSVTELRERLREKEWAEESAVERVIARLQELGYLNDEQFAASYANARLTVKPLGRTRLRRDLQRKKLSPQTVENALTDAYTEHSEEELIDRAVAKRVRLKGTPQTPEAAKKLFDYLLRRGFSFDLVRRKVREASRNADLTEDIAEE